MYPNGGVLGRNQHIGWAHRMRCKQIHQLSIGRTIVACVKNPEICCNLLNAGSKTSSNGQHFKDVLNLSTFLSSLFS